MCEGDRDRTAQVLGGRVGDHDGHNSRVQLQGGLHSVSIESRELFGGLVNGGGQVLVAQQRSKSEAWLRKSEIPMRPIQKEKRGGRGRGEEFTRVGLCPGRCCPVSVQYSGALRGQTNRSGGWSLSPLYCDLCVY